MSGNTTDVGPERARARKLDLLERIADDLAHEIKNPLHSMVINLEVLRRRIQRSGAREPDDLLHYADIVGDELERVSRRIDLLLRVLRPDRGAEPTTLDATVHELLEVLELEAERRGVDFRFVPGDGAARGRLAPDAARQLVLDLVLPGIDATPAGGTLVLRSHAVDGTDALRLSGAAPDERGGAADLPALRALGARMHRDGDDLVLSVATEPGPKPPPPRY